MKKIQLSIPEPCHQRWENMTPTQQGRFCNACAKEVIDFSEMSDTDVLNYFSIKKNDQVCGRAYPDQLNRSITSLPAKKISWYWHYAAAFLLFFSKSTTAKAQGLVTMYKTSCTNKLTKQMIINSSFENLRLTAGVTIEGSIQTASGQTVPYASIKLLHSNHGVVADSAGKFLLKIDSVPCIIEISSLGYETRQVPVNDLSEQNIVLPASSEILAGVVVASTGTTRGKMVVSGMVTSTRTVKRNTAKDTLRELVGFFNPAIKIYPNPIMQGHAFTVGLNLKQTGSYTIQIINAAGSILLERKINILAKKHNELLVSSNTWSSGIYYLRVIDAKGKHIETSKMVVQYNHWPLQ